jgi:hypothetical protein
MAKKLLAISFIYGCCCLAWLVLGGTVEVRTHAQDRNLGAAVGRLWGGEQVQPAPQLERVREVTQPVERTEGGRAVTEAVTRTVHDPVPLAGTALDVALALEHRKKGLLWYPTYRVDLDGRYRVVNATGAPARYRFTYAFPQEASVFDSLRLEVDGKPVEGAVVEGGRLVHELALAPGEARVVRVAYGSQGVGAWRYRFGEAATQVRDFRLAMTTDFDAVDFPPGTLSPTHKRRTDGGWHLVWAYGTLVADGGVGMVLPQRLNPGPWVRRVTFFAPVSLFLFFFVLFVVTLLRGVRLHPMHYFFLGCAFFAFHLLLAYLVDHVAVPVALAAASAVSVGLVVSYVRLVAGLRFALVAVGGAQLVYLVGFAYTFFLEGFTGLAVTGLSVATLFVVMQATGRVDWEALLRRPEAPRLAAGAPRPG